MSEVEEESDFIEESLALAPEPYKTIIRKRLDAGFFGAQLKQMEERYELNEEQIDTVTLMVFRAACDPDIVESLKDALIADADVSYEAAVKIQRDIIRDVLLPIKEEGALSASIPLVEAMPTSGDAAGANSTNLFSDHKARVTTRTVTIGGATYPVSTLARYVGPFLVPHMGFIGDIFQWGDWYVAVHFTDGEERDVFWSTRDEAGRFARAIHQVMT